MTAHTINGPRTVAVRPAPRRAVLCLRIGFEIRLDEPFDGNVGRWAELAPPGS